MISRLIDFALVVLKILMFNVFGIIGISNIDIFNFSCTERVKDQDQKQPPRGVPRKMCSENMQQNYRRTPMAKCDFNEIAKQLY